MSKTTQNIIVGVSVILLLGFTYGGYRLYPVFNKPQQSTTDTIIQYDTVLHYIPDSIPYYIVTHDSIIYHDTILENVDTAAILKDYFAVHYYERHWKDSLVDVTVEDYISQNRSIENIFKYKLLKPQTIINTTIDNTITYNRYLYFGLDMPIKNMNYTEIEAIYSSNKFYTGVGYTPELNSFDIKLGMKVLQFKKKK